MTTTGIATSIYLKQQRLLGRDAFRAMVEAKIRRFAGIVSERWPRYSTPGMSALTRRW